jgi:hypothetical protein
MSVFGCPTDSGYPAVTVMVPPQILSGLPRSDCHGFPADTVMVPRSDWHGSPADTVMVPRCDWHDSAQNLLEFAAQSFRVPV